MTPKEKAKELFNKYFSELRLPSDCEGCMQCVDRCSSMVAVAERYALIAVDEILKAGKDVDEFCDSYWLEVKKEIEQWEVRNE